MVRPQTDPLTERELEVMHLFWRDGEMTAQEARDNLEKSGRNLTYTTVATLCRLLHEKGYLERLGETRPFSFKPCRSFEDVSGGLVSDMIRKVFQGSREQLLLHIVGTKKLSPKQRAVLQELMSQEDEGVK